MPKLPLKRKTLLILLLLAGAVMLYLGEWIFTAHDDRADLIQNFTREQTIYRFDSGNGRSTSQRHQPS
jgi:hypothetical protein